MALRELLASFGVQVDSKDLDAFNKKLSTGVEQLANFGQAVAGGFLVKGITSLVSDVIEAGSAIRDTSDKLGVGTDELQKFQFAAGLVGVSAEEAAMALGFLNKNMGAAIGGDKGPAQAFAEMGIKLKETTGEVRPLADVALDLSDAFASMGSQQERTAKAMGVFGKAGAKMLPLLQGGSAEVQKLFEEFETLGGGMSEDLINAADEAGDQMDKLKFSLSGVRNRIVLLILPALQGAVSWLTKVSAKTNEYVHKTNIGKIAAFAFAAIAGGALLFALVKLAKAFGLVADGAGLLGKGTGLIKLGLWGLAILALILIVEDLYTLFTGGDSAIGKLIDSLFGVGASAKMVEYLKNTASELWVEIAKLEPMMLAIGAILKDVFGVIGPYALAFMKGELGALVAVVKTFVDHLLWAARMIEKISGKAADLAVAAGIPGAQTLMDKMQGYKNAAATGDSAGDLFMGGASAGGQAYMGVGKAAMGGDLNQKNDIQVVVQGGNTNAETGKAVAAGVRSGLGDSNRAALDALFTGGDD